MLAAIFAVLKAIPAIAEIVTAVLDGIAKAHEETKTAAGNTALTSDLASIQAFVAAAQKNAGPSKP